MILGRVPLLFALSLLTSVVLWAPRVSAQACCTATASSQLGVVGRCYRGVLATQLGYDRAFGSFARDGTYAGLDDASVQDLTLTLAAGLRLFTPALQVYTTLPLRLQQRSFSGVPSETRVGTGDATAGLRAILVDDLMAGMNFGEPRTLLPFVEPFVVARAPTGRAPSESNTATQADVMGDGAWALAGGVVLTKFVTVRQAVSANASYGHRFAHSVSGAAGVERRFSPGAEIDVKLAYVEVLDLFWSWSLFTTVRWTLPARSEGQSVDGSESRRVRLGASVSHYLTYPKWQLIGAVAFDPPVSDLSQGVPYAGATATLSMQRNFTF